jgi:hypothetical protein
MIGNHLHEARPAPGNESRRVLAVFEIEHDKLLGVGSVFTQFTTTYEVTSILPGSGDSVGAEAEVVSGPGQQV